MGIRTLNPATGELVRKFDAHTDAEVEAKLEKAAATFRTWKRVSFAARIAVLPAALPGAFALAILDFG